MIPLEPITGLIGMGVGAYVKLKSKSIEANESFQQNAISALAAKDRSNDRAAKRVVSLPKLQGAMQFIVFTLVGTYALLHLGVNLPELFNLKAGTTVGYTEIRPGFLFIPEKETVVWKDVPGGVLTPSLSLSVWLIVGFFFGQARTGGDR